MTTEFRMPSLGADMAAGKLVERLKQPGTPIHRGDVIAVVETQKGAIEVEVFTDGVLDRWLVEPGATVPVGTPLALILETCEAAPAGRVAEVASAAETPAKDRILASPAARKLAEERGISLVGLGGSGPGGAIISTDLGVGLTARRPSPDMVAMRDAIAAAMARSKREIPHYYLAATIDLLRARVWLDAANQDQPPDRRVLMSAVLAKATTLAVRRFPEMNGFLTDSRFRPSSDIHLGFAIAIRGGGLVAPAIHHADRLPVGQLMAVMRELIARARSGGLRSSELADPTITATILGERGGEAVFPIITPPQVAIVGFGREAMRPWVDAEGQVVARPLVTVTLAADHRVSDGHRGGLFLAEIDKLLQRPEAL